MISIPSLLMRRRSGNWHLAWHGCEESRCERSAAATIILRGPRRQVLHVAGSPLGPRQRAFNAGVGTEVRPQSIGRVLGIGLRVAAPRCRQKRHRGRVAGRSHTIPHVRSQARRVHASGSAHAAKCQPAAVRAVAGQCHARRCARPLASGFFKPFRSVGGKIWLEVTGVFFLLPVLVFTPVLWRTRASWQQGPDLLSDVSMCPQR